MLDIRFMLKICLLQLFINNSLCMVLETCLGHFDVHKNTIIRTGESQALGGKYLEGVALDTMEECQRLCCETEHCDVYIFEAKSDGFCYLFECGAPENFHCKFTRHANYTSAVLTKSRDAGTTTTAPGISDSYISQQEIELTKLKSKPKIPQVNQKNEKIDEALSNMAAKAQPTINSVTSLPLCDRFQFACHSGECIAVYNACDGIPQCVDGSDEGPECSGAPAASHNLSKDSATTKKNNASAKKLVPTAKTLPKAVDNREDQNAWMNRKIVAELQHQLDANQNDLLVLSSEDDPPTKVEHLKEPIPGMTSFGSVPTQPLKPLPPADVYAGPITSDDEVMSADLLFNPKSYTIKPSVLTNQRSNWTPGMAREYPAKKNRDNVAPTPPPTTAAVAVENTVKISTKPESTGAMPKVTAKNINQAATNTDDDSEDYEEKVTQQPKKKSHKHKKEKKPKVDELDSDNKPATTQAHAQVKALQEQHKVIHETQGLEFHEHDGHAERPGGAMISLTLGLLVTAALAIVIGCRMRVVRRRMRRPGGKSFSHDSDFLVNGMYL